MYCAGIKNFKAWKKRNKKSDAHYCDKVCKKKCNKVWAINFLKEGKVITSIERPTPSQKLIN